MIIDTVSAMFRWCSGHQQYAVVPAFILLKALHLLDCHTYMYVVSYVCLRMWFPSIYGHAQSPLSIGTLTMPFNKVVIYEVAKFEQSLLDVMIDRSRTESNDFNISNARHRSTYTG